MKILAVLALLISLCSASGAPGNLAFTSVANNTQAYGASYTSPGVCTATVTYTASTMTLAGTFTCVGLLGNLTAAHIHNCGTTYDTITYNDCPTSLITDCPLTINADLMSGSFNCVFTNTNSMTAICNDQCYFNYHTEYDASGEARANLVNMRPMCYATGFAIGSGVVTVGTAVSTLAIPVPDFYVGWWATALSGTGGGYVICSWDSTNQTLTVSGCFYGLTGDITGFYFSYPGELETYFLEVSYYTFPSGCPFSFRFQPDQWGIAKLISAMATVEVDTSANPNGELSVACIGSNFPTSSAPCTPYTGSIPSTAINCYDGYGSTVISYGCSQGEVCGIDSTGTKSCISPDLVCYTCGCNVDQSGLASTDFVCCNSNLCNSGTFAGLSCLSPPPSTGAGSISVGFLVTLVVAVFMKWFN